MSRVGPGGPLTKSPPSSTRSQHAEALEYFVQLAAVLDITVSQQTVLLGGLSVSGYRALKSKTDLVMKRDMADRVAYGIRIFQRAGEVNGDPARWLRGEQRAPIFQGKSPLDHMLRGGISDLIETYDHLRSLDGGWA